MGVLERGVLWGAATNRKLGSCRSQWAAYEARAIVWRNRYRRRCTWRVAASGRQGELLRAHRYLLDDRDSDPLRPVHDRSPFRPDHGDRWRANFYRIDRAHDADEYSAWSPTGEIQFHMPNRFGYVVQGVAART